MRTLQHRFAFTLAEVLITLGIIGVVAALTIPTLMANYQKVQEIAGLKKAYAEITEALKLMATDAGCPDNLGCVDALDSETNNTVGNTTDQLGNQFKKYFKLAKDCGSTYDASDANTKCLSDSYSMGYKGATGGYQIANMNDDQNGGYNFITADGFAISLRSNGSCDSNDASSKTNLNLNQDCGQLIVDINGSKGPNFFGRDIFVFLITNGKGPALYPMGGSEYIYADYYWNSWIDASGTPQNCYDGDIYGNGCAGRIMEEGWQMKY